VKEYRNGELLSVLQRDFQFNVSTCENLIVARVESDTIIPQDVYVINSCGSNTVDLVNLSQPGSVVTYDWEFDLGSQMATAETRHATITFPGLGSYNGLMILNRSLTCTDTAKILVNIYPGIESDFEFEYDTCTGAPVEFTDLSSSGSGQLTSWSWDFGDSESSQSRHPRHLYGIPGDHAVTLRVRDINMCEHESTQVIPYFPVPPYIIIEPSTFNGCTPARITFTNLSTPIDETYDIVWDFGDGGQSFEISPVHTYETPGLYSLHIAITSPIGCFVEAGFDNWINVRPSPRAGFSFSPTTLSNFNSTVTFTDESLNAVAWQWAFGDENVSFVQNPTHTFRDTGIQFVRQVVFHENGCTDTASATIDVVPEVRYFLPNAFTPNFDSKNDYYKGVGAIDGMTGFEMSIWSRWGARVFHTTDPNQSWNGRMDNTGEDLPQGVYVCVVRYRDPRDNPVEIKEFATLIR
jgi:gliding motility-associated-like protein